MKNYEIYLRKALNSQFKFFGGVLPNGEVEPFDEEKPIVNQSWPFMSAYFENGVIPAPVLFGEHSGCDDEYEVHKKVLAKFKGSKQLKAAKRVARAYSKFCENIENTIGYAEYWRQYDAA